MGSRGPLVPLTASPRALLTPRIKVGRWVARADARTGGRGQGANLARLRRTGPADRLDLIARSVAVGPPGQGCPRPGRPRGGERQESRPECPSFLPKSERRHTDRRRFLFRSDVIVPGADFDRSSMLKIDGKNEKKGGGAIANASCDVYSSFESTHSSESIQPPPSSIPAYHPRATVDSRARGRCVQ